MVTNNLIAKGDVVRDKLYPHKVGTVVRIGGGLARPQVLIHWEADLELWSPLKRLEKVTT